MRLALLSQVCLLLIGLVVPIGVPAVMGLDYYGHFVAATASAFLVQRLADFPAETLIFASTPRALLLRASVLQMIFLGAAGLLVLADGPAIDILFLLGLQISSVAFAMVLCCRSERLTLAYLSSFLFAYLVALAVAFGTGRSLAEAISVPNYLSLVWVPIVLRLRPVATSSADQQATPFWSRALDFPVRVAAGSFVALATLGLSALSSDANPSETAQVRLLGTALGMAAFLLPWPMKSLVGLLRTGEPDTLRRLQHYLLGTRLLAVALIVASAAVTATGPLLLCAGMCLLFLNYQVVERWNIAGGRLVAQAGVALLSTMLAYVVFRHVAAGLAVLPRSSLAIMLGCVVYGALSQWLLLRTSAGRPATTGLWSVAAAAACMLTWSHR